MWRLYPSKRKSPKSGDDLSFVLNLKEDVFQNANLSREKVTEAVCPSLK